MRTLAGIAAGLVLAGNAAAAEPDRWEGWIVGAPCVGVPQIADCPLRYVDRPVLLLADGRHLAFRHGGAAAIKDTDVDAAYGRKVRIQGRIVDDGIVPVRIDLLEATGERKFFKGCL